MKDDSGNYARFTEQGVLASHMTAPKVVDFISRIFGCSDAVSAYTQVEMKDATELLHLPDEGCPKVWTRSPRARRPYHWGLHR